MNEDHADAVQLYAGKLLGLAGSDWRMTGIDAEGIDLRQAGRWRGWRSRRRSARQPRPARSLVALVGQGQSAAV